MSTFFDTRLTQIHSQILSENMMYQLSACHSLQESFDFFETQGPDFLNPLIPELKRDQAVLDRIVTLTGLDGYPRLQVEACVLCAFLADKRVNLPLDRFIRRWISCLIGALTITEDIKLLQHVITALGNFVHIKEEYKDYAFREGIVSELLAVSLTYKKNIPISQALAYTFSSLCAHCSRFQEIHHSLIFLNEALFTDDLTTITHAVEAISQICKHHSKEVIKEYEDIVPRLIELLQNHSLNLVYPSIKAIGYILHHENSVIQHLMDFNLLPSLLRLIDYPNKDVQNEALWVISNISTGRHAQIQLLIEAQIIPKLISLLKCWEKKERVDREIFKESAWILVDILSNGTEGQVQYMLNQHVLESFCEVLKHHAKIGDVEALKIVLEGFQRILLREGLEFRSQFSRILDDYHIRSILHELMNEEEHSHSIVELATNIALWTS